MIINRQSNSNGSAGSQTYPTSDNPDQSGDYQAVNCKGRGVQLIESGPFVVFNVVRKGFRNWPNYGVVHASCCLRFAAERYRSKGRLGRGIVAA
jgi:hypothetical protein